MQNVARKTIRMVMKIARTVALLLAVGAAGGAWATTLTYGGGSTTEEKNAYMLSGNSASPTTVFAGLSLTDMFTKYSISGNIGGGWLNAGAVAGAYNAKVYKDYVSMQFQAADDGAIKGVIVRFQQSGNDVVAYAVKYAYKSGGTLGVNLETDISGSGTPASSFSANGYNIHGITLTSLGAGENPISLTVGESKPYAVWNGDIVSGSSTGRAGYFINANGNTVSDGVATIDGSSGGIIVTNDTVASNLETSSLGVVARFSNAGYTSGTQVLAASYTSGNKDRTWVGVSGNGTVKTWTGTGGTEGTQWTGQLTTGTTEWPSTGTHYFGATYSAEDKDVSSGKFGWRSYVDGVLSTYNNGMYSYNSDRYHYGYGYSLGGTTAGNVFPNAEIDFIAIVRSAVPSDIAYWSLTGMSTVSTDINTTTITDGVNLPATATLTAAATPAAVFVQQTSTLTVADGGSLTIGNGNGPLYVATGATLTIDASGMTLSAQNPSVTILSAHIFGIDQVSVTLPSYAVGGKITASVSVLGITLSYEENPVEFTSPFDGTTLAAPTVATVYDQTTTHISFGNSAGYFQTVNERDAIVVDVTGGTYTDINGFLKQQESTTDTSKDVYLRVSGGTSTRINGVQEAHWQGNRNTRTTGNAIVQIDGSASVGNIYGAGYKGGVASEGGAAQVDGSTGVVLKGGSLTGSIVGGWSSAHNQNATVTGNTAVRIETLPSAATTAQDISVPNNYIIGGSVYQANSSSSSTVSGNSAVTLALSSASGSFLRNIVGGSAIYTNGDSNNPNPDSSQTVTQNSTVSITASDNVSFGLDIVGGGLNRLPQGSANVGGDSAVTITGGTYTGRVVAGGYSPNGGTANVAGSATLTINSGVFTGATLDGGNATGAKTLVIGDNFALAGATVTGFTALTLGDGATAEITAGSEGAATLGSGSTLKLIIGDDEIAEGHEPNVTGSGTVEYYEYVDSVLTKVTDAGRIDGNNLLPSAPVWSVAENASGNLDAAANWSTGSTPVSGAVKFQVNGSNTLTINATHTYGSVYVVGSGTLTIVGDGANMLTANHFDIASGVTVSVGANTPLKLQDGNLSGSGAINVAAGSKLVLDGVTKATTVSISVPDNAQLTIAGDGTTTLPTGDQAISGNILVEAGATLVSPTTDSISYTTSSSTIWVYGTLTLNCRWSFTGDNTLYMYPGAVVNGTGDSAAALDLCNAQTKIYVCADPDTGATGMVTCAGKIRLRANSGIDVAEGMTLVVSGQTTKQSDNCGYTKTGAGDLKIQGSYAPGGTMTINAGKVIFDDVSFGTQTLPGALAGTGIFEICPKNNHCYFEGDASAFSGKFIVNRASGNKEMIFRNSNSQFGVAAPPELVVSGQITFSGDYDNKELPVRNFSGSGTISAAFGSVSTQVSRTINTLQTEDTAYSGQFTFSDNNSYHRNTALTVRGADNAAQIHTLALSGQSTTYGALTVTNNAKVVFTSTGKWQNGAIVVGDGGYLESTNTAAIAATLTLQDGATVVRSSQSVKATTLTALDSAATIKIAFADGVTPEDDMVVLSGTWADAPDAARFAFARSSYSDVYEFVVTDDGVVINEIETSVTVGGTEISVGNSWLLAAMQKSYDSGVSPTDMSVATVYLANNGLNGMPRAVSYLLGLENPDDATTAFVMESASVSSGEGNTPVLTFTGKSYSTDRATVTYKVFGGDSPDSMSEVTPDSNSGNVITVTVPTESRVKYYKLKMTVTPN